MNVTVICGAGIVSGKELMVLELVRGLSARGVRIQCITSSWGDLSFRARVAELFTPLRIMRLGFISATISAAALRMTAHQAVYWPWLLISYRKFLRAHAPKHVIHTNWHHLILLWPLLDPGRDFFWLHESMPAKPQYERLFRLLKAKLKCFVAISDAVADSLLGLGVPAGMIRVVRNGIEDPAGVATSTAYARERCLVVGIVGQIGPWKGHDDLFEAFSIITKAIPNVELHIFGRGDPRYEAHLQEKAVTLGFGGRAIFRGFVSNRAQIYSGMDVCVVPSVFEEPLGMVAVEAAFFGIPVVATRRGGLPEVVEDGITGLLTSARDPKGLATCLISLLKDSQRRHALGQAAKTRAPLKFGFDRFISDFAEILHG